MTSKLASAATAKVIEWIAGSSGLNGRLGDLSAPGSVLVAPLETAQIRSQNAAAELAERGAAVKYPAINVYCEKMANTLGEKFRSFSGSVQMAIELRHSQDNLTGLQDALELYSDALMHTLDSARGDWGNGMFYAGGYEVSLGAVKHGGKNFIQSVKITFQIGVSRN